MEIRDYKPGDEKQILKLFEYSFEKKLPEEYWHWRFIDNPQKQVMVKLMWDNETLAGHYAVSPLEMIVDGEKILTALSMTTMTHPNYTGKGIFTELAEKLYQDESEKSGLKAVWGFPNNNSHYGFIKNLKWIDLEQIPTFSIKTDLIKKTDYSKINIAQLFSKKHVATQNKLTQEYKIKTNKSIQYLDWRYSKNPINKYDIFEFNDNENSYFVVTKVFQSFNDKSKHEVDILEFNFPPDFELLLQLMNAIKNHYSKNNLLQINTWLPCASGLHLQLEKIGFINTQPITYSGIRVLDPNYENLKNSKEWSYSMGDSDIY